MRGCLEPGRAQDPNLREKRANPPLWRGLQRHLISGFTLAVSTQIQGHDRPTVSEKLLREIPPHGPVLSVAVKQQDGRDRSGDTERHVE